MADQRPDTSEEGTIEEGVVGISADVKTIRQLTSSSDAAKAKRYQGGLKALDNAFRKEKEKQMAAAEQESGKLGKPGSEENK